jgi:hypothetical protein
MNKDINAPEGSEDKVQPESLEPAEIDAADLEKVTGGTIDNKGGGGGAAWTHNGTPPNILCC